MTTLKDLSLYEKVSIGVAEFLGTGILVLMACMGATTSDMGAFQPSLVSGLAVLTVIHLFGHVSGAFVNPVTTVCAIIMGKIDMALAPIYLFTQITGGVAGFGLLKLILPQKYFTTDDLNFHGAGMTLPGGSSDVTTVQVFFVEFVITVILSFANCASWDPRVSNDSVALRFGFIVAALNFMSVPFTGCSMNPARSFGPAVWYNDWELQWVYWVAPLTASVVGSVLYRSTLCDNRIKNLVLKQEKSGEV